MGRIDAILGLATAVAAGLVLLNLAAGPATPALIACLGALLLELCAAPLPAFGFFGTGAAAAVGGAVQGGPAGPALALLLGTLLRALGRGRPELVGRVRESLADLVPALAGVAVAGLLRERSPLSAGLAGAATWWVGCLLFPVLLAAPLEAEDSRRWGRSRLRLALPWLTAAAAAVGIGLLAPTSGAWLLVLLLGLQVAAWPPPSRRQAEHVESTRLAQAQERTEEVRYALEGLRLEASRKDQELKLLERLIRSLTRAEALNTTLDVLLDMAMGLAKCQSAAIFLRGPEGLVPARFRTPLAERLQSAALLELEEPIVHEADRLGRLLHEANQAESHRIFEGEASALAVPIEGEGVLYLGAREPGAFDEHQVQMLMVVAAQGAVALQSARRRQAESEALALHRKAHTHLQRWVDRLATLLDGTRALASTLDQQEQEEKLESAVQRLVPHQVGALIRCAPGGRTLGRQWSSSSQPVAWNRTAAEALATAVESNRRPLLLDDLAGSRFAPPVEGAVSLLMVPLMTEQAVLGLLLLASPRPGAFGREDQDLLYLLAYLAAVAFTGASRHQQLAQAHAELARAHQQLRESQAQLVQASKMAAVGQLAAGVAHELNTPIGAITLSVQGALRSVRNDPDRAEQRLEKVLRAAQQAATIVSKLLVYCRGGGTAREEVELSQVVEDTLILIRSQLEQDGVEVVTRVGPCPPVQANASELQQVLTNLLVNARDAVLEPAARARQVEVRLGTGPEGGSLLEVEDTGPGLSDEVKARLFEPFFTTRPVGKGTGLGLSICQRLVTEHGGTLEGDNSPRGGAVFRLRLPSASF